MRKIVGLVSLIALCAMIWIGWAFHPWMRAGQALQISSRRIGDYEFQVWQRKNDSVGEPFATALFAHKPGGKWMAFLLDFEDIYRPSILLREAGSRVDIFYGRSRIGVFDETQQTYRRDSDGSTFTGVPLNSEPPDDWWLKPQNLAHRGD